MGQVYLAEDVALGREAAIKVLPASFTPELKRRFLRESQASARLQHPAVATFYVAGEVDNVAFLAMAYVPGETLREKLSKGPMPIEQTLAIADCLLEALAHIHACGLIHRASSRGTSS